MLVNLIALVGIVGFPGGSANDFAKTLGEATHQNVVVCQSYEAPLAKVDYDPTDLNGMARAFRAKTGLIIAPGARLTLNDGMIDPTRIQTVTAPERWDWKELGKDAVSDGKVTFETNGKERLDPASLAKAHFSRPVTVHWFYSQLFVSVWAHGMPEQEFLSYVAKSIGAQLVVSPKEYKLDFDAAEIRRRAIHRIETWPQEWASSSPDPESVNTQEHRFKMLTATLEAVSTGDMNAAFKTENDSVKFAVPRTSPVVKTFVEQIKGMLQADPDTGQTGFKTPAGFVHFPDQMDASKAIELTLAASFRVSILCHFNDADGKPGQFSFTFSGT